MTNSFIIQEIKSYVYHKKGIHYLIKIRLIMVYNKITNRAFLELI